MSASTKNPLQATSIAQLRSLGFDPTRPRRRSHIPSPIVPYVIATSVLNESAVHLDHELPAEWAAILTFHAEEICAHNKTFRRRLQGEQGRDLLRAFMRHWLSSILANANPELFAKLPSDFQIGLSLPPHSNPARTPSRNPTRDFAPRVHGLLPQLF